MPDSNPQVSVVMAVFNGGDKLLPTIDSILGQTFEDFEFIIVDDGSSDATPEILLRCADRDSRIRIARQLNAGLTAALIHGTSLASGEFIARQDVGDRSLPRRFENQVRFLRRHPNVVALGAGNRRIGPGGEWLGDTVRQISPEEVTQALLTDGTGLSHTVAMIRRDAFEAAGGYRREFRFAQDTDLWHRMLGQGLLAELPEVLFEWEIDIDGISSTSQERQLRLAELARCSFEYRRRGEDDAAILEQAKQVSWSPSKKETRMPEHRVRANAEFFIGSQLFSVGDGRCRHYLLRAAAHRPYWLRPWLKILLSLVKQQRRHA